MANNTVSINKIVSIFRDLADRHDMIADFDFGEEYDINASRQLKYPYLWVDVDTTTITKGANGYKERLITFSLLVMDRIDMGSSNYQEIISDTHYIMETIISEMSQHPYYVEMNISLANNVTLTPVIEATDANCNGYRADITLKIPIRYTYCNSPIVPISDYVTRLNGSILEYRLEGLPGADGATGPAGANGATGPAGVNGATGPSGENTVIVYSDQNDIQDAATAVPLVRHTFNGSLNAGTYVIDFITDMYISGVSGNLANEIVIDGVVESQFTKAFVINIRDQIINRYVYTHPGGNVLIEGQHKRLIAGALSVCEQSNMIITETGAVNTLCGEYTYYDGAYHTLQGDVSPNIGSGNVGNLSLIAHLIKPNDDFEVANISINIISNSTPGNCVVAIYDLDVDGYPSTKLFQTTEFDNLITGIQTIAVTPYTLEGGKNYAIVFQSSQPIGSIRRFVYNSSNNGLIWGHDGLITNYGLLVVANTYNSTFPTNFPAGASMNTTAQIAVYFQRT